MYHSAWARLHDHLRLHLLDKAVDDETDPVQSSVVSINAGRDQSGSDVTEDNVSDHTNNIDQQGADVDARTDKNKEKCVPANAVLLECISQMNPEHKEVVLLRFCFSMNNQEIADFLDVNKNVVDRAYSEAVKVIRSDLVPVIGCHG